MTYYDDPTDFAWIITKDHLYDGDEEFWDGIGISDSKDTTGPREAPDLLVNMLKTDTAHRNVKTFKFDMYDDDTILYYSGRLAVFTSNLDKDGEPSEEALSAPLADFGKPNSGAVLIKYAGHPSWTMEA